MAAERTIVRQFLRRFEDAGPATWLLAALAGWALLLWLAALLGLGGRTGEAAPGDASAGLPQPGKTEDSRLPPLAQFAVASARPLFTNDRRPRSFQAIVTDGSKVAEEDKPLDFILTGVLISPQVKLAILQPSGGGESQRVREGKPLDGATNWRLVEVKPRQAVFENGSGQSTLDLRTFGVAAAPPPPPPPPASPAAAPRPANDPAAAEAAAKAAEQAARDAAAAANLPPPTREEQARVEEIRRRIEARRAQLRTNQPGGTGFRYPSGRAPAEEDERRNGGDPKQ